MGGPPPDTTATEATYAVLIDAGYLYAAVGALIVGDTRRVRFRLNVPALIPPLIDRASRQLKRGLLRVYWYDAARDRVPTVEQRQIAALPHVKVRLGNLNAAGQQKGVDALVRQDLEVLARHRAVSDVVLIAGDEDMVSAVEAAQAYGVRVHVWGVEPPYGVNQAERLVWEADTVDELDAESCRPYVTADADLGAPGPREPIPGPGVRPSPAVVSPAAIAALPRRPPPPPPPAPPPRPSDADLEQVAVVGEHIAGKWLVTRGRDNVAELFPGPTLPQVIDKELLVEAEGHLGYSLRPHEEARQRLRKAFLERLNREFSTPGG